MAAYVQQNNSRRMMVLAIIIGFHILLAYGLVSGLARKVVEVIAPPLETDLIEEIQQEDKPPPPPPPEMERPPVEVPPPEVTIDIPMDAPPTTAITDVTDRPVPPVPPAPPPPRGPTVKAKIDARRFPSSEDYYPASAKRLGQQGNPTVRVCVGANGRLIGEPTIAASSGVEALDQGAIKLAKAGRYIAGQTDGQPAAEDCFSFRVKFELKD
jgi:protein TonB